MNLRFIDWIWRVRGAFEIAPGQSSAAAFAKVDSLFQVENTNRRIDGDTLSFTKSGQRPQDKMSIFDSGTLHVENGKLYYDMMSRALLACFLAPLLFFAIGKVGVALDQWRNPPEVVKAKAEAAKKRQLVKPEDVPMNWLDQALGAPQPEKKKKDGEEVGKKNRKPSMTTAYAFMGIFFALWLVGRILENYLIHTRLRNLVTGSATAPMDVEDKPGSSITGEPAPV